MIKKVSTILLVLVAIAGVTAAVYRQSRDSAEDTAAQTVATQPAETVPVEARLPEVGKTATGEPVVTHPVEPVVSVTYFTTSARCASCLRIEEWTRKTVDTRFAEEVAAGRVSFQIIYIDNPANKHYIQDYQLVSKSVVVSEALDGQDQDWVNLQDVWLLLRDEQAFIDYVAGAVSAYL
jgi:hypothetical protein